MRRGSLRRDREREPLAADAGEGPFRLFPVIKRLGIAMLTRLQTAATISISFSVLKPIEVV